MSVPELSVIWTWSHILRCASFIFILLPSNSGGAFKHVQNMYVALQYYYCVTAGIAFTYPLPSNGSWGWFLLYLQSPVKNVTIGVLRKSDVGLLRLLCFVCHTQAGRMITVYRFLAKWTDRMRAGFDRYAIEERVDVQVCLQARVAAWIATIRRWITRRVIR